MNRMIIWLAVTVGFGLVATSASAQTDEEHYEYRFDDENLLGNNMEHLGERIKRRPGPARTLLLRPRVSLVPPLLKSVENI